MTVLKARQTPTRCFVLSYTDTRGKDAVDLYEKTGRKIQEWQELLLNDILSIDGGLWVHTKYGYSVPRRNGKNEIVSIRELYGLMHGERILHTAHRTTTSHAAAVRLAKLLDDLGYHEVQRVSKEKKYELSYTFSKQFGLERIVILTENGGSCDFRTRTSKGGLGEGFDLLIIDEAQEYADDQESSLKYVVTDSKNPQTLFCGTPPTAVSSGTVFVRMRENVLSGGMKNAGWAEWSIDDQTDPHDRNAWYETNPSLGTIFTERSIEDEIGADVIDFNIQRLGLWIKYNQRSAITEADWSKCLVDKMPDITGHLYVGIKYGKDATNVSMTIAVKTTDGSVFVNGYDCRSIRDGDAWIIDFLKRAKSVDKVIIDGAIGQNVLTQEIKNANINVKVILPTVKEVINASTSFETALFSGGIVHLDQPSMMHSVTNCEKRPIGVNGGFGYKSTNDDISITLLESMYLAYWICKETKGKKKQRIRY